MENKDKKNSFDWREKIRPFNWIIIAVAIAAYASQLSINAYYKVQGTDINIKKSMNDEIAAFYKSPSYKSRYTADSLSIATFNDLANQKKIRNKHQLDKNGKLKHDESILALADSIKTVTMRRESWAQKEISIIRANYEQVESAETTKWGGIGLVFVFETLAVIFGFMAARRQRFYIVPKFKRPVRLELWACLAASFYAQRTSCLITEQALILLIGNPTMAESYATAFMLLCPLFFIIGGFEIDDSKKLQPMATITRRTASLSLNHETTEMTQQIPISEIKKIEPKNGDEAVLLYAKGLIGQENGWPVRRIARIFFGDESKRTHVHNLIKAARDNGGQTFVTSHGQTYDNVIS